KVGDPSRVNRCGARVTVSTAHPCVHLPWYYYGYIVEVARPSLSTTGYYFARTRAVNGTNIDARPGEPNFGITNTTPLILTPFGQPLFVTAWAKQAITNGFANK